MTGLFAARPSWRDAPEALRSAVAQACGSPVLGSRDLHGGMSPGPAGVLRLADGRQVFVKAVSREASIASHRFYRQEATALSVMPSEAPAPKLLARIEVDGWCALVMSLAEGGPAGPPWTSDGVALVAAACEHIGRLPAPAGVPPIGDLLTDLDGWQRLADGDPGRLDRWERRHAEALAGLAAGWPAWTTGTALVHQDIRADNAVVDPRAGRAVLVDWSFACSGAGWLDRARLAADVVGTGHRDGPAAALRTATGLLGALPADAPGFVAALAGMWRYRSTLPAPPGHPTLRPWQRERSRLLRPLLTTLI
ncbi:phosphotransferase [Actinoplanes sp. M2I2]|uniref:phosphotransferase family protein n=1 Tax=Actinoplanes sp. M2I2 TaxID=1734444 RepID=UPI00201FCCD7|nr:phosphotransferase [Actinoplanes sp. M2I2]